MQIAGLGTRGSGTCGTGTAVLGHAELGQRFYRNDSTVVLVTTTTIITYIQSQRKFSFNIHITKN